MLRKNLIFLGDSITDCDRLWDNRPEPLGSGYVRFLREMVSDEYTLINRGHNGFTAWQVAQSLEEDCLTRSPDFVTLLVGINDVCANLWNAGGYGAVEYGSILKQIVDRIRRETGAAVMIMEPFVFPWPQEFLSWMDKLAEFQKEARNAAAAAGADFLPLADFWEEKGHQLDVKQLTADGIHLTETGHRLLAQRWLSLSQWEEHCHER
ncbi:MAG: GDSL-type esterase/lipase family protein [Clostridiales bacterium]|nr:GDSL-type esterase/lipase family protein [Clostridiales bacterium]